MNTPIWRQFTAVFCAWLLLVTPTITGCGNIAAFVTGFGLGAWIPSYTGVPGNGGAPSAKVVSTITNATEGDYEKQAGLSTGQDGTVTFESPAFGKTVNIEVVDENGNALEGMTVDFAARDGLMGLVVSDPAGVYGDSVVFGDPYTLPLLMEENAKALATMKPIVITAGVALTIKIVLVVATVLTVVELADHLIDIGDFVVSNLDTFSLEVTTFRAPMREVVDLIEDVLLSGVCIISLATPVKGLKAGRYWGKTVKKFYGKAISKQLAKQLTDYLISEGARIAKRSITEETEVIVKIDHLGLILPGYKNGVEIIIPEEAQTVDGLLEEEGVAGESGEVYGIAEVIPTSGVAGRGVTFEVRLDAGTANQVSRIEFFIDTTGEGPIEMNRVSDTLFEYTELVRPQFPSYPTVSTFTFIAYSGSAAELARGSATDTVFAP